MKKQFDVVVAMPIGPNTNLDFVTDTVRSYLFYTASSCKFVFADDSHQSIGKTLQKLFPDADVLTTQKPMGGWAGLYINEANAFRHAVLNYHFKALLKLDTDALVIGEAPEREALELFNRNPSIGMAGQYPNDYHGKPWDTGWPRDRVLNGATTWKYIRRPLTNWYLRRFYRKASANGYRAGESVFGGAYFMSYDCLHTLMTEGLLPHQKLRGLNMGEDHIFSLLVKAAGFHLGELSAPNQGFGLAWKGLPVAPQQLLNDGKKIIHSTRYFNDMSEAEIRSFFQQHRYANVPAALDGVIETWKRNY